MAEVIEIITDPGASGGVNDLPLMGGLGEIEGYDKRTFKKPDDH